MKLTSLTVALTFLWASASFTLAADKSSEKPKAAKQTKVDKAKKTPAKPHKQAEQVALTGSYIKRDIHRNGVVTDGPSPVVVVNEDMIRNSGAADVRELLVRRGLSR